MAVEVVFGILASSLALLSDAAHMLTDAGALALALVALRLAARPAKGAMTYGLKRTEILSAQFNGATLLVLGLLIVYEGIRRLIEPPDGRGRRSCWWSRWSAWWSTWSRPWSCTARTARP